MVIQEVLFYFLFTSKLLKYIKKLNVHIKSADGNKKEKKKTQTNLQTEKKTENEK